MGKSTSVIYLSSQNTSGLEQVFFNKKELGLILNIYGKMVSAGLWRDYSFEAGQKSVAFNAFKRSSDQPAYRIIKIPHLANKQGAYAIVGGNGQMIKRGALLDRLLTYFNKKLLKIV